MTDIVIGKTLFSFPNRCLKLNKNELNIKYQKNNEATPEIIL